MGVDRINAIGEFADERLPERRAEMTFHEWWCHSGYWERKHVSPFLLARMAWRAGAEAATPERGARITAEEKQRYYGPILKMLRGWQQELDALVEGLLEEHTSQGDAALWPPPALGMEAGTNMSAYSCPECGGQVAHFAACSMPVKSIPSIRSDAERGVGMEARYSTDLYDEAEEPQ